jgi:hypothetical protein
MKPVRLLFLFALALTAVVRAQDAAPASAVAPDAVPQVAPAPVAPPDVAAAPAAPPAPEAMPPTTPAAPVETPTPPASADEPVAKAVPVPVAPSGPPAAPRVAKFPLPNHDPGVLEVDMIGHRFNEANDSGGWGWVKYPNDSWKKGRWIALEETPGTSSAPWRVLGGARDVDQNVEYKMHGFFAPYQVYDPHTNEMLDVFVLESYETIGPAQPLSIASGPDDRHAHVRSTFSSRRMGNEEY